MPELHDGHPRTFRDHHAGGRPLRRVLVPTRQGKAGGVDIRPHRPFHQAPDQQRQQAHEAQDLDAFRLREGHTLDHDRLFEQPVVLLRPVLLCGDGEDIASALGEVPRGRHSGAQHEAARLFIPAGQALALGADGRLEPIPQDCDGARLGGAWPAPAILGPFLHGDIEERRRRVHGAPRRRRGFRIGAADIRLLLCGARGSLQGTLRRLERTFQPLLPPCVLCAGVEHHRPLRRPVECDLALIGFIGRDRTVPSRLRVGEDADLFPCVVCHSLGDAPPACIRGGW